MNKKQNQINAKSNTTATKTVKSGNNYKSSFNKKKLNQNIKQKARKILVVIDVQNDFITGSLGNIECQDAAKNIVKKLKTQSDNYDAFYFTKDVHYENYLNTLEGKKLPIIHCIAYTSGCKFIDDIYEQINILKEKGKYVKIITKHTFGSSQLADILSVTTRQNDEIELCGVCTDICVVSNALMLRQKMPNKIIKVNPCCCAGTSKEAHEAALMVMNSCQIDIINNIETTLKIGKERKTND